MIVLTTLERECQMETKQQCNSNNHIVTKFTVVIDEFAYPSLQLIMYANNTNPILATKRRLVELVER